MTRGDKDAQQFPVSRFQPLYCLRGKVWSRPILFVANPDLFKKMRWTAHGSTRKRSQMADVRYADCTAAQQHLWAGRRFRKHTKVCPPSTYDVAGRPSVVWKKTVRGSNVSLSTNPGRYLAESLPTQRRRHDSKKLSSRVGLPPPPRDRLGRGRPSPIDGRPPVAGFGKALPGPRTRG